MHFENPTRMAFRSRPPRPACGQVQHHATTELDEGSSSVVIYQLTSKSQQMGKSSRNAKLSIAKVVCVWPGRDKNHTKVVRSEVRDQRRVSTIGREMIVVWKMKESFIWTNFSVPFHSVSSNCAGCALCIFARDFRVHFDRFSDFIFINTASTILKVNECAHASERSP